MRSDTGDMDRGEVNEVWIRGCVRKKIVVVDSRLRSGACIFFFFQAEDGIRDKGM